MAHKTLIGGTAYESTGGKTLVGGTAYSIVGGKTLVSGTAYTLSFSAKTFTFTINNVTYTAEVGMTWNDWVNSSYNTYGYYIYNNYVMAYYDETLQYYPSWTPVSPTDTIISGENYIRSNCCLVAGTQVMISLDGETRNIEAIEAGDSVVSYNIKTAENYITQVVSLVVNRYSIGMAHVEFADGRVLDMTVYHPLYTKNGWHSITNKDGYDTLVVGDMVKTANGWVEIVKITRYNFTTPVTTYTLDVEDFEGGHTENENDNFYANGIVVHNGDADCGHI